MRTLRGALPLAKLLATPRAPNGATLVPAAVGRDGAEEAVLVVAAGTSDVTGTVTSEVVTVGLVTGSGDVGAGVLVLSVARVISLCCMSAFEASVCRANIASSASCSAACTEAVSEGSSFGVEAGPVRDDMIDMVFVGAKFMEAVAREVSTNEGPRTTYLDLTDIDTASALTCSGMANISV
jgi:hypothetical protein